MIHTNRRTFMLQVAATSSVLATAQAYAQATGPKLEESDPQAAALGYKQDTTKVDAKKYPNHAASQSCATCQLFQGKAKDASGGCPLFAGKQVAAAGWCSAWVKKPA
jgi:High potential iron-sulfur protein